MILRKPYAILIKNFKLIHLLLAGLTLYILYKTYAIFSFFNDYLNTVATTISNEITSSLFGFLPVLVSILIVLFSFIILALMKFKDKPIKLYMYNIIIHVFFIVYYAIAYSTVKNLETSLVDVRTLKILGDITTAMLLIEAIGFVICLIRSTGFDIKSFNFKKDLEDLDIETEDSEEFEVNTDIDTNRLKRNFNKKVRHLRYIYIENKLIINIISMATVLLVTSVIVINNVFIHKKYKLNQMIETNNYLFDFERSYVTKYDYKNNLIDKDTELVIIKFKARTLYGVKNIGLGSFRLDVDGYKYYHKVSFKDKLFDFGETFNDQSINNEFSEYILVFEISKNKANKQMKLRYMDNLKTYTVDITPTSLDKEEKIKTSNIDNTVNFDKTILDNTTLKIKSAEVSDSFRYDYQLCIKEKCNPYFEYLVPSTNSDASYLMKLEYEYTYDQDIEKINTFYKFVKYFGKIKYLENGEYKEMDIPINEVKTKRAKSPYTYIEITDEVAKSSSIIIEFNIRGKLYEYKIK